MLDSNTLEITGVLSDHTGLPLAMEYFSTPSPFVVAACADSSMAMWNMAPGRAQFRFVMCWSAPHAQTSLRWCAKYTTLYSGGSTGLIHTWDVRAGEETCCMRAHTDMVTDLLCIPSIEALASCSMDRTIALWDLCSGELQFRVRGHEKGVVCLAYSEEHRLLISAGADHDAFVWSPFVPTLLYKLRGHFTSLVGVICVQGRTEVVTAAVDGQVRLGLRVLGHGHVEQVRVWDLRTYDCVQTLTASEEVCVCILSS